jgi:hypothetical protein
MDKVGENARRVGDQVALVLARRSRVVAITGRSHLGVAGTCRNMTVVLGGVRRCGSERGLADGGVAAGLVCLHGAVV